jgi:hypothetical protein
MKILAITLACVGGILMMLYPFTPHFANFVVALTVAVQIYKHVTEFSK